MSIIKSFSVENGDMFYIRHVTDNFTIIDCCLSDDNKEKIVNEIKREKWNKDTIRFISTHPDEDHIKMLNYLDDEIKIPNFYCVKNEAKKDIITDGFRRYCKLRDSGKAFHIYKGFVDQKAKVGIRILWPDVSNKHYNEELEKAKRGTDFNNISCVIQYSLKNSATVVWMGDLEENFMEKIKDEVILSKAHIVFAPHHGRKTGKIPKDWLNKMKPEIIVVGEADSEYLNYYRGYKTITQLSAKDITFNPTCRP